MACGDGRLNGTGNRSSIGLEICENSGGNREKAGGQCQARLVADLLSKFGLGIERVVQHNKWSGKNCPRVLRGKPTAGNSFLAAGEAI